MKDFKYYIFADKIDHNDDGEEQFSVYRTKIVSDKRLTPNQAISLAEAEGDWKVEYGVGEKSRIGTYVIEEFDPGTGETTLIADMLKPQ